MDRGIGSILLNFSVAVYLIATGILGITRNAKSEIQIAVTSLFKGDFANVLIYGLAVIAIAAGVFILIKFFGVSIGITENLLLILAVTWVVFVIFVDIIPALNGIKKIDWILLLAIGSHVMVLSGIMLSTERFGG